MELYTWITLLMVLELSVNVCISHASRRNYVKPYENLTCPDDQCMTFEAYTEAAETYFVSNTNFVFLPGDHHYSGCLRLINVTNMQFQGPLSSAEHPVQIIFHPGSNLTFITSHKIILSNLSFTLSGSWIGVSSVFVSIEFRNSSSQLSGLTVVGSMGNFISTAFLCRFSFVKMTNIQISGAKSVYGGALWVSNNSIITLSGSNMFVNNSAMSGGAISVLDSTIFLAGVSRFEGNHVLNNGGAVFARNATLIFSNTATFIHNRAQELTGGAIVLDSGSILLLERHGNLYFRENFARSVGGAMFINNSTAQMWGQLVIQWNSADQGALAVSTFSTVICYGKSLYIENSAYEGGAVSVVSDSQMFLSNSEFEKNYANNGGGALSITTNGYVNIKNSRIVNNSAGSVGGAIHLATGILEFAGINYIEHNMGPRGGGIETFIRSLIIFTGNNHFINNTSSDYGGALSAGGFTTISIQGNLSFINNTGHEGGAVFVVSSTIEFDHCVQCHVIFDGNVAERQGGAIYSVGSTWSIRGSLTFHNNSATLGGGMSFAENSKLILNKHTNIVFSQNHADTNGGAIYVPNAGMSINQCRTYGGKILVQVASSQTLQW